jgi:hypothetical protein
MKLTAKPIIKNQYWVVTDGNKKVGNVFANDSGFDVKINGHFLHFKNTIDMKRQTQIEFQSLKSDKTKHRIPFASYPTTPKTYNDVFDVKRKLHLYTKTQKSKCYYAAGYYILNQNGQNEVIFCPKYIFIQRYPYIGPFETIDEANIMINKL